MMLLEEYVAGRVYAMEAAQRAQAGANRRDAAEHSASARSAWAAAGATTSPPPPGGTRPPNTASGCWWPPPNPS